MPADENSSDKQDDPLRVFDDYVRIASHDDLSAKLTVQIATIRARHGDLEAQRFLDWIWED